ncbi:MAG TPA: HEAT repeat domain-containing protein [Phycisphaerae bacterium]|nr:HEAT repeat domain-containing protein [Phycisphaerae bacterium]HUT59834.1 HEAT repeat domain-containing protein [Phycisphaerae bacterium]
MSRHMEIAVAAVVLLLSSLVLPWTDAALHAAGPAADSKAGERIAAYAQMAINRDPNDRPAMLKGLSDPEPLVRRHAIYALERIGDKSSAARLIPLLKDSDGWVPRCAAIALGKLRAREAVKPLCEALKHEDVHLRFEAFVALGRIGDPSSQKPIIEGLQDKRIWTELGVWDQRAILRVMEREFFTDRDVIPVLKGLLSYKDWEHPEFAGMTEQRKAQLALLISNGAAEVLTKFGDGSGEKYLIEGLAADDYMQQSSAYALGKLKSAKAVPGLVKMLSGEWMTNRRRAVRALGEIGDASAVPALEKLMEDKDDRIRMLAAQALAKIDGKKRRLALVGKPAKFPEIPADKLDTPGGKRPPQFICLGVDDCVNIEGMESILDVVQTLHDSGAKAVFTLWVAPLAADPNSRDLEKQKIIYQRLFDMGCEIANHTLRHNPRGIYWTACPYEEQVEAIEGAAKWYRDNVKGFIRPFSFKGGGGASGTAIDPNFSRQLLNRQRFLYSGRRGQHPNQQTWPKPGAKTYRLGTGCLDGSAPPVHETITNPIRSDYSGTFDFEVPEGLAMWKANFEYHYNHPRRPILAVNAFHDWGFKTLDDSVSKGSHRNEAAILKAFLMDVLVTNKTKYPQTHCVTFRQVIEYVVTDGDLKHTLAAGNCQDSRNPVKPKID